MEKFEIEITSVPDREKLVAEIWIKNELIAEINQENGILELELYCLRKEKLVIPFEEFAKILEIAKSKLMT